MGRGYYTAVRGRVTMAALHGEVTIQLFGEG